MSEENRRLLEGLEILKRQQSLQNDINSTQEERRELQKKIIQAQQDINKAKLQSKDISQEEYDTLIKKIKSQEEEISKIDTKNEKIKQGLEALKEQEKIQKRLGDAVGGLANKWRGGILESILDTGVNTEHLAEQMAELANPINIVGTALSMVIQSTIAAVVQASDLRAQYVGATGDIAGFQSEIIDGAAGVSQFGVGMAEMTKSTIALRDSMSTFTTLSSETRNAMAATAASFENLGISSEETARNMQTLQMSFGMTGTQALETQKDFVKMAKGIGVPMNRLSKDFASNASAFAAYGKAGTRVFIELSKTAKQTGLEMNDLLSITQQFDTFEGAADSAGKLNALLGGPFLDSMQLLTAESEAQRVAMLQNSIQMSGKSFDSMSKFEKMAVANAAGISDMGKAAALFSEKARAQAKATDGMAMSQEELNELQRQATTVSQDFGLIMQQMAVFVGPLVSGLKFVTKYLRMMFDGINNLLGDFGPFTNGILVVAGVLGGLYLALKLAGMGLRAFFSGAETQGNGLLNTFRQVGTGIRKVGEGVGGAMRSMFRGLASGIRSVFSAITSSIVPMLTAVGSGIAAMVRAIGSIPPKAVGIFALVALSIAAIAYTAAMLVNSFTKLMSLIIDNLEKIPELTMGLVQMGTGFFALANGMYFTAGAFGVLALGALAAIVPTALAAASIGLLALSFGALADSAKTFADSMKSVKEQGGITEFISVVNSIDDANIGNLEELIDEADRMVMVQAKIAAMETANSVSNAIDKLISVVAPETAGGQPRTRDVILQINDREFGRAVVEALDDDMKLSLA